MASTRTKRAFTEYAGALGWTYDTEPTRYPI
jgi:hypothetical protein